MLFRIQFPTLLADIQPAIGILQESVETICTNAELHELLLYILEIGNFINAGSFAGNACGYSVSLRLCRVTMFCFAKIFIVFVFHPYSDGCCVFVAL